MIPVLFLGWDPLCVSLETEAALPAATLAEGLYGFRSEVGVIIPHLKFGLEWIFGHNSHKNGKKEKNLHKHF